MVAIFLFFLSTFQNKKLFFFFCQKSRLYPNRHLHALFVSQKVSSLIVAHQRAILSIFHMTIACQFSVAKCWAESYSWPACLSECGPGSEFPWKRFHKNGQWHFQENSLKPGRCSFSFLSSSLEGCHNGRSHSSHLGPDVAWGGESLPCVLQERTGQPVPDAGGAASPPPAHLADLLWEKKK